MLYVLSRFGMAAGVILGSVTLVFLIVNILPGDVATLLAGDDVPTETVNQLREELGLDRPLIVQYLDYVAGLFQGDLGTSYANSEPVLERLLDNLGPTLALTISSMIVAIVLGLILGILSAVYQNKLLDGIIRVLSLIGVSTPNFWIGILLIWVFSVQLHLLPSIGNGSFEQLILPSIGLGITGAGVITRLIRNSILEASNEPFIRSLRGKGIGHRAILFKHILRHALIPAVTMVGMIFGEMLAGSVVTETVFSRQGLGRLIVDAIDQKDIPIIQGAILFTAAFYVVINMLVDISYRLIDPRIRLNEK